MTIRTGGFACPPRTADGGRKKAPRLVCGVTAGVSTDATAALRDLGWDVTAVASEHVRRSAFTTRATAVVLPVSTCDESGWLVCAKLVRALPRVRVVLVGPADEETERFALFAGAVAYVPTDAPAAVLVRAVTG